MIVMCLLDLFPMAFSSRPYRLVGRDGERGRGETRRDFVIDFMVFL